MPLWMLTRVQLAGWAPRRRNMARVVAILRIPPASGNEHAQSALVAAWLNGLAGLKLS
jgi:hypothetical protein